MANLTITKVAQNAGPDPIFYPDLYTQLKVGDSVTTSRPASAIPAMTSIINGVAIGDLTLAVQYTAQELSTGLMSPPQSLSASDVAPVAPATGPSLPVTMRFAFAAGAPAIVPLIPANAFPFKARVLSAKALIKTAGAGGSTAILQTQSGGGTTLATFSTAATGTVTDSSVTQTFVVTPGTLVGLFLNRSDSTAVGEILVELRPET